VERIVLVANAAAGSHEQEALESALGVLQGSADVEVVETSSAGELEALCERVEERVVVVAGGDGTLHATVNALHRHGSLGRSRLGLIPLGTGNDFARGVGIPLDPIEAAALVVAGITTPTDLIVDDTGTVVVNNAHLGVGAQASRAAVRWKPRLGRLGYAVGALSAGLRPQFLKVSVTVDGTLVRGPRHIAQVAIGNGSHVGGGTELIPGAHPASGQLLVIVSRARGRWTRLAYLARLQGGSHHLMREVERACGQEVTVEGEPFRLISDGEISGPHSRRTWTLLPGAVEVFLPARSGATDTDVL
jgi:diacylglycerol kinase (ATP)